MHSFGRPVPTHVGPTVKFGIECFGAAEINVIANVVIIDDLPCLTAQASFTESNDITCIRAGLCVASLSVEKICVVVIINANNV